MNLLKQIDPKQRGGVGSIDTNNCRSYGTVTDKVRHYRNCSSKTLPCFGIKKHYVKKTLCLFIKTSYQNLIPKPHTRPSKRSAKEISQDLRTRASYEHPRRTFRHIQTPMHNILVFRILMQGPLGEIFSRVSTGSSHNP